MANYQNFDKFMNLVQGRAITKEILGTILLEKGKYITGRGQLYKRTYVVDGEKYTEECFDENNSKIEEECLSTGIENIKGVLGTFFEINPIGSTKDQTVIEISPSKKLRNFLAQQTKGNLYFPNYSLAYRLKNKPQKTIPN